MVCNQWSRLHNIVKTQEKLNYTLTSESYGIYELSLSKEHKTKMARTWCSQAGWGGASPEHPSARSAPPPRPPPSGDRKTEPGSSWLGPSYQCPQKGLSWKTQPTDPWKAVTAPGGDTPAHLRHVGLPGHRTNLGSAHPEAWGWGGGGRCWKADIIFSLAAQQQNNSRFCVWGVGEGTGDEAGSASGLNGTFQTLSGGPRHLLLSLPGSPEPGTQPLGPPTSSAAPDPSSRGSDSPTPWSLPSPPPRPPQSQACEGGARPTPVPDVKSSQVCPVQGH